MDRQDRDEAAIDLYFEELGTNSPITSLEIFRARIGFEITEGQSFTKIVEHFWHASRAASLASLNKTSTAQKIAKDANKMMSRKLGAIYDMFSENYDVVTIDDLEKIMALHMRLQTVPTQEFMARWQHKALTQIDQLSDEWFKANFDHFTKLGIYPQDEFIKLWWHKTKDRIDTFESVDQFRILYKMATLDFLRTQDYGDLYANTPSPCRSVADHIFGMIEPQADKIFPHYINNQVFFAGLWFGKDFVRHIPVAGDDGSRPSKFEDMIAESIATNVHVDYHGIIVPVTGHKIDLELKHQGIYYGCEVDGISHFNRIAGEKPHENGVIYNASTRFHSFLTAQNLTDINVIRIPYFLFDKKKSAELPWGKTLSSIARKEGHGVYAWHGGSLAYDMQTKKNAHIFMGYDL